MSLEKRNVGLDLLEKISQSSMLNFDEPYQLQCST